MARSVIGPCTPVSHVHRGWFSQREHPAPARAVIPSRDIRFRVPPPPVGIDPPPVRQPISIARAGWRDLRVVAALQRRAFPARLAYGLGTLIVLKLLPNVRFLVARRAADNAIIGCGIGDRHEGQSRIINLAVDPAARRQGVGGALLLALEAALPHGDLLLMVQAENEAAKMLYHRLGYREVGRAQHYYGAHRAGIWMQKSRPGAGGGQAPKLWV